MTSPAACVVVFRRDALTEPLSPRGRLPRPVACERIVPGAHLVLGRRGSPDDPPRQPDGDGVRVALDQLDRPQTSQRHLELVHDRRWSLEVLAGVKSPTRVRSWGRLTWQAAEAGSRHLLAPGRPLAVLLPGVPGYLVVVAVGEEAVGPEPVPVEPGGTEAVEPGPPVELSGAEVESLARTFRPAVTWPPRPTDDPLPTWTTAGDAARKAFGRLLDREHVRDRLELGDRGVAGADLEVLERLVLTGALDYGRVRGVADACDVAMMGTCPGR